MISEASDFSELFILWPHFTKSRKKEEGGETQSPTVKVGWLGRHLSMMPLSHPPSTQTAVAQPVYYQVGDPSNKNNTLHAYQGHRNYEIVLLGAFTIVGLLGRVSV